MAKTKEKKVSKKPTKAEAPEETAAPVEEEETEEEEEEAPAPTKAEAKKADDEDSVDVIRPKASQYIRTFSLAVHGENFRQLAEQFAGKVEYVKREYAVVNGSQIKEVQVRYREKEDAELSLDEQKPDAPIVDKSRRFTDKEKAIAFANLKKGSCVISVPKKKK